MKWNKVIAYTVVAVALVVLGAMASVPRLINYQGILTDDAGVPITGSHDLTFAIYADSAQGATALWSEPHTGVEVDAGLFNVILGGTETIPEGLFAGGDLWMGIAVDGGAEMSPRMQLTSVPWAFRAALADSALSGGGGGPGGLTLPYADSVSVAYSAFAVKNEDAAGSAIRGENKPNGNAGYLGHDQYGVYGTSAIEGVRGQNSSGHYGRLGSANYGASGQNSSGHWGVLGGPTYGAYGRHSNGSHGYLGQSVYGVSGYSDTVAVHGYNSDTNNYGRLGMRDYAVYGRNSSGNIGYLGSNNYGAVGFHANGNSGYLGGTTYGVYGTAPGGGYAGYFGGKVFAEDSVVAGTIHSTSGGFKFPDGTIQTTADSNPGGLTLPYADSISVAYSAFAVKNEDAAGSAIRGENKPNGNAGYLGHDQYGVYGTSATEGVRGQNSAGHYGRLGSANYGASGQNSSGHWGVLGGPTYGVYGRNTNSNSGYLGHSDYGVAGYADTVAVHGYNSDVGNYGRLGTRDHGAVGRHTSGSFGYLAGTNYGALGANANGNYGFLGGSSYAVYGTAPGGGYAGYFAGNVFAQDTLDVAGTTRTDYLEIDGGADLAEPFDITGTDDLEPGSVVVIDAAQTGVLQISTESYDTRVAGVISGAGGIHTGLTLNQNGLVDKGQNVALSGRVYVRATASNGPIRPGDLLTTSSLAGHAMRATDSEKTHGAVLGKAMSSLETGEGLVLVLVSLQ